MQIFCGNTSRLVPVFAAKTYCRDTLRIVQFRMFSFILRMSENVAKKFST
uniref:AlNc14C338G10755 protein n=1 Tax=Albugo laibachii Nc14 TaxID=890382 RepID=F0WWZ4_9STRA|nr:AlNc14C338G10755 [Albugo laibachii Nc14]|eukprot:CCA25980.1 AlNc14C338G10755 [Albugo laibachii Nc14]